MGRRYKKDETGQIFAQEPEYRGALDELRFCEEAKERMAQRLVSAEKTVRRPRTVLYRTAAVALALVLVTALTVGAGAAGVFKPVTDLFAPLFGGEESQLELIERMGTPLEVSDTRNGVIVTAEAMLNDGENVAVLYSVSRENGESLIPPDAPEDGRLLFASEGITGNGWTYQRRFGEFIEYSPGAPSASYIEYYAALGAPADLIPVYMGDLEYWYGGDTQIMELVEKSHGYDSNEDFWQLDLPVADVSCPVRELSEKDREFTANGFDFVVTSVRISPISVKVTYELQHVEVTEESKTDETLVRALTENMSLVLRKKDGTEIDLGSFSDEFGNVNPTAVWEFSEETNAMYGVCGTSLEEIVPLEEMDCVIFNGMKYPVNP